MDLTAEVGPLDNSEFVALLKMIAWVWSPERGLLGAAGSTPLRPTGDGDLSESPRCSGPYDMQAKGLAVLLDLDLATTPVAGIRLALETASARVDETATARSTPGRYTAHPRIRTA